MLGGSVGGAPGLEAISPYAILNLGGRRTVAVGIARTALRRPPLPVTRFLFPLFYLVEIRHRQLPFNRNLALAHQGRCPEDAMRKWQLHDFMWRRLASPPDSL